MADIAYRTPRMRMTLGHGGRGILIAAAATAAAGDHSIEVAIITVSGGVAAVIIGPFVTESIRNRKRPPVNHPVEHAAETQLLVDHLVNEIAELKAENDRLRRRRRD